MRPYWMVALALTLMSCPAESVSRTEPVGRPFLCATSWVCEELPDNEHNRFDCRMVGGWEAETCPFDPAGCCTVEARDGTHVTCWPDPISQDGCGGTWEWSP
jgi:hypothetical protein